MDPAAFHQVLSNAMMNLALRRARANGSETYDSMKHHALAVRLVNQRIRDRTSATSDGFIGALVGFACYHVSFLVGFAWKTY